MSLKELLKRQLDFLAPKTTAKVKYTTYDDLINAESAIGRTIFGPVPAGRQREFFKHRENVWIWHENWTDELGNLQNMTIRYEVRPEGVFKRVAETPYVKIEGPELNNFVLSVRRYHELVKTKLYC